MNKLAYLEEVYNESFNDELEKIALKASTMMSAKNKATEQAIKLKEVFKILGSKGKKTDYSKQIKRRVSEAKRHGGERAATETALQIRKGAKGIVGRLGKPHAEKNLVRIMAENRK